MRIDMSNWRRCATAGCGAPVQPGNPGSLCYHCQKRSKCVICGRPDRDSSHRHCPACRIVMDNLRAIASEGERPDPETAAERVKLYATRAAQHKPLFPVHS